MPHTQVSISWVSSSLSNFIEIKLRLSSIPTMKKQKCRCACACSKERTDSLAKRWNPEFFKKPKRTRSNDPLFIEVLEDIRVERHLQDAFLQNTEASGSSWEVEQVQKFFREARNDPAARLWRDYRVKGIKFTKSQSRWHLSEALPSIMTQEVSFPRTPRLW